jgi:uncharacterized membrane protein YgcG
VTILLGVTRARAALAAFPVAVLALALLAGVALGGPPFPDPVEGAAVYDPAGALSPEVEANLERRIDEIEARSAAEVAVYVELEPGLDTDTASSNAAALMDQWGVGRGGFDDGLVIYAALDETLEHGQLVLYGGSGFDAVYANADRRQEIFDNVMVPLLRVGDVGGAIEAGLADLDPLITADGRERLDRARQLNAVLGLIVGPIALLGTLGAAAWAWYRSGRDPDFLDSESILMAGPPAEMTPPLANVVQRGRAGQEAVTTGLVELAARGRLRFGDLDRDEDGAAEGPSIELLDGGEDRPDPATGRPIDRAQRMLLAELHALAGSDRQIDSDDLARLHERIGPYRTALEGMAVQLGWFREPPGRSIGRWSIIATVELVVAVIIGVFAFALPASGLLFVAGGLGIGALATFGFAQAMPQRTPNGARIDGMLKAYRRTLKLTMEQARSMEAVVAEPSVRTLADTPDKAVMWGIALGLHEEVSKVLERSLEDRTAQRTTGGYYPLWLGSGASGGGPSAGGGGIFSGSAVPNIGGMFAALGSIGTAPSSSGSGGGGFSGGSSGGGSSAGGGF